MKAYRLCKTSRARAAFSGEGARLAGGRWTPSGVEAVYCSETLSLAALEILVHADPSELLRARFVYFEVEIPDDLPREEIGPRDLPRGWRRMPAPAALQEMGAHWVRRAKTAVLIVPSAVNPAERNLLLNPNHSDFRKIHASRPRSFSFDPRLAG